MTSYKELIRGAGYVLIGEEEGDYGDFYERPRHALAVSDTARPLEDLRDALPTTQKYKGNPQKFYRWERPDGLVLDLIQVDVEQVAKV